MFVLAFSTRSASSRAYKSNQHENNAAPSDTTHIKQTAFSDFSGVGVVISVVERGMGRNISAIDSGKEEKRQKLFFSPS